MPATSKAQMRYMFAVQNGSIHKPGLSKEKAKEFTSGVSYKSLPEQHHAAMDKVMKKKKAKMMKKGM